MTPLVGGADSEQSGIVSALIEDGSAIKGEAGHGRLGAPLVTALGPHGHGLLSALSRHRRGVSP